MNEVVAETGVDDAILRHVPLSGKEKENHGREWGLRENQEEVWRREWKEEQKIKIKKGGEIMMRERQI